MELPISEHGCVTGDCPHYSNENCYDALHEELETACRTLGLERRRGILGAIHLLMSSDKILDLCQGIETEAASELRDIIKSSKE